MTYDKQLTTSPSVASHKSSVGGHVPVLLNEVLKFLEPKPGEFFIDGTFGAGGHSRAIQERIGPPAGGGRLLAIDWEKTGENYADLVEILKAKKLGKADGLLLDLGFSSEQLGGGKGFSFQINEPLAMVYDINQNPVRTILKELTEKELAGIIRDLGGEKFSGRIARVIKEIIHRRGINTTFDLAEAVKSAVPGNYEHGRIHPATRTFQALRIYANNELGNLEKVLKDLFKIVKSGGRVAIISFHSLEDKIVKNYFRDYAKEEKLKILTKKPVEASDEEVRSNPRSRSAKIRAAQII
ncbi:MAG: 16S rRNA (cytosine(1402)-N(4))-methyltransferase RsmH [bacterium]|nr:16S rRNA (cytosine(1402)-N(4))-methyltransferase RsmH [bacterium]